jgi:hypothetical protein
MSYLHIENLYKNKDILLFKECYAMEKIHGTSAHISWNDEQLHFFAGGTKYEEFITLFDRDILIEKFKELGQREVVVYGEAYGGRCQGMSETYGDKLRFVAFEVKIGDMWLNVPLAEHIARGLGLDFVHYVKVTTDINTLNQERDAMSVQAVKNGIAGEHKREGIVLRPLIELTKTNGARVIAKHKADEFQETKTKRSVDEKRLQVLTRASEIADEWVTPMRLTHVLQKFTDPSTKDIGNIIITMIEDIEREGKGEIIESNEARKEIGRRTALMFKDRLKSTISINKKGE